MLRHFRFTTHPPQHHEDPFPTISDLPHLTHEDAERALNVLRGMTLIDTATVYTAAGSHGTRWQVWLDITRRRVTLQQWADEWLASQRAHDHQRSHQGGGGMA